MNGENKMKLLTVALGASLVAASAVSASPHYVGERMNPKDNITLGFQDTPTKKALSANGKRGNIAALELSGDYNVIENLAVGAQLPFYMINKNATGGSSRNNVGNMSLSLNWHQQLSDSRDDFQWGYSAALDTYLPTSRKVEAGVIAGANPTTDFYAYSVKTTTIHPRAGLFIEGDRFAGKTNLGYGYMRIQDSNVSDKNRNTFTWQTAATWRAMSNLDLNLEYNTIILDKETAGRLVGEGETKFRHSITPSVSGNYESILGQAFVSLPLDKATRDVHNVAFGAGVGYMF